MRFAAPRDSEELMEVMDRTTAAMASASAECLQAVAHYDHRKLWRRDGATSMSSWLAARYGLAWGTAREWVRVAHALQELPRLARAYGEGRVSLDQLRPVTRFCTPETDERWAEEAPRRRPAGLWREAKRHQRTELAEANEVRRRRYLELWEDPDLPVVYLEGMLPSEEGAAVRAALEQRAESVVLADDPQSHGDARMADALVELVTGGTADDPPRATVVVHAGADVLTGEEPDRGPWLGETEHGGRLPSDAIRRLACDGRIEWVLEGAGRVVGIGRRGRTVQGALLRVLRHRDEGTCRFPGCERKRWLQAHHLIHWADGGGPPWTTWCSCATPTTA